MLKSVKKDNLGKEGYVYVSYGHPKYLKHVVASAVTLRRYDKKRPIALACTEKHRSLIEKHELTDLFTNIYELPDHHASIVGFKHNFYEYLFFDKNLFLDSDIVWCKNPDNLWRALSPYKFTVTGNITADNFFGAPKGLGVIKDILLSRRRRTLKRFNLTYLSRAQTGIMYAEDYSLTKKTCELAKEMLKRKNETHFQSRKKEKGRTEESCEWSLAMAMSQLNIPVYPWFLGYESPQLDYIKLLTDHDKEFEYVKCKYFANSFVYSFRGLKSDFLKKILIKLYSIIPGKGDYLMVTPYCLHFGWYHEKEPFFRFSESIWEELQSKKTKIVSPVKSSLDESSTNEAGRK